MYVCMYAYMSGMCMLRDSFVCMYVCMFICLVCACLEIPFYVCEADHGRGLRRFSSTLTPTGMCMYGDSFVCVYVCMYVCMYVCLYVWYVHV
jgi:hypothetical protein